MSRGQVQQDASQRYQTGSYSFENDQIPSPQRINTPRNTPASNMNALDQKIHAIFSKHQKINYSKLFRACLKVFTHIDAVSILNLIFKNKCPKQLRQDIQRNNQTFNAYRKSSQSSTQSESNSINVLQKILQKSNTKEAVYPSIQKLMKSKNLMNLKSIQDLKNIPQNAKKQILTTILENDVLQKYFKPKPIEELLFDKLRIILPTIKQRIEEQLIEQFSIDKNFDFLSKMDDYESMEHISLNKGEKDLIISICSTIPQYKLFTESSSKNIQVLDYDFTKHFLVTTTIKYPFSSEKQQISLKYQILQNLIKNPQFNIYEYGDRISKQYLSNLIDSLKKPLQNYITQKNYVQPLERRKQKDIDSLLEIVSMKIEPKKLKELKAHLMQQNYTAFFGDNEISSSLTVLWNKYYELPNCTQAFEKQNRDLAKIEPQLRWKLNLIFIQYQIPQQIQQTFIKSILKEGNLRIIQKSDDVSKATKKKIISNIKAQTDFDSYIKVKFQNKSLAERVKKQLINVLINIPIGSGKQSLQQPLSFKKIFKIVDKLIQSKKIELIRSAPFLTSSQKPIIIKKLKSLIGNKGQNIFKNWICWQGIDLDNNFNRLKREIERIIYQSQIDCNTLQIIQKRIKNQGDIDFISSLNQLTQSQKYQVRKKFQANPQYIEYQRQYNQKKQFQSLFDLRQELDQIFDNFDEEDIQIIYKILTQLLEPREDIYQLNLTDKNSLRKLMQNQKIKTGIQKVMKNESYQLYSQNFPLNLKEKQKKVISELQKQIVDNLEELYPEKHSKNQKIYSHLQKYKFNISQIRKKDQEQIPKRVLDKIQNIESLKNYNGIQFVKNQRIDIISNCNYKKYIKNKISKIIPSNVRDKVQESLIGWDIKNIVYNKDLSENQKEQILETIAQSNQFQECSRVISSNTSTNIPNFTQGILEIINFCTSRKLDIEPQLVKLSKSQIKISIQNKELKTYPISTTLQKLVADEKIGQGMILKFGNQEVTEKNFGSLALNNPQLNLKLFKKISLKHKNSRTQEVFPVGSNICDQVINKIPSLREIKFEVTNGADTLKGEITQSINSIVVQEIKTCKIGNQSYDIKTSSIFKNLKDQANIPNLSGDGDQQFGDNETIQSIYAKHPSLKFKSQESNQERIKRLTQVFLNWEPRGEKDQWGNLKTQEQAFKYAYEKIFINKNLRQFVSDQYAGMKKIKRTKLRDYLQDQPQYVEFAEAAGVEIIEVDKK